MKQKVFYLLGIVTLLFTATACSENGNDEEYRSEPPLFSDFTIKNLSDGSDKVHVGDKFVVTAEQRKKGRLIYKAEYTWTNSSNFSQKYKKSVVYDKEPINPSDTLVATSAGALKITFKGKYYNSGNVTVWSNKYGTSFSETFASGQGSATYTTSGILYFDVEAHKTFTILP